ncbi:unnamed protein product [Effrenium voratum]|uniref:NHL repeat containing protein n=1 Tax=Effrenium voratum TaxID=2562239 RepID=A0AA36JM90_9DINO|nr:unnamed protein product [Effrenium voratum]
MLWALGFLAAADGSPWQTVAGTGRSGFGGASYHSLVQTFGVETRLSSPWGLALGGGRLYIADSLNHVVRSLDLDTGLMERPLPAQGSLASARPAQFSPS